MDELNLRKKMKHLTQEQRYAIYLGLQNGRPIRKIAKEIGVSPSTVSRELKRNSKGTGGYGWIKAQQRADSRKMGKRAGRRVDPMVEWEAMRLLEDRDWSPEQISGSLALRGKRISRETIYKRVRANPGRYAAHCHHRMRRKKRGQKGKRPTKATNIPDRVGISQRPKEADGTRFGDWEMDLIVDSGRGALLTLTERSTNMLLIAKLPRGKRAEDVARAACRALLPYKDSLKTITTDNGSEFARHGLITRRLGVPVFFTDAYSSWQKGAVENANKLVRFYLPKGTRLNGVSERKLMQIQMAINSRPRKKLNFLSPKTVFFRHFD